MEKVHFSKHVIMDREERYLLIATKVGFGEIVKTTAYNHNHTEQKRMAKLSTTGVVTIWDEWGKTLITVFCGSLATIKKIFYPRERMSQDLFNVIRNNEKRGYCSL